MKQYIEAQLKTCPNCGHKGPKRDFIYGKVVRRYCTPCCRRRAHEHYLANQEEMLVYSKAYEERTSNELANDRFYQLYWQKIRMKVLTHYGGDPPKCSCCGDTTLRFLCLRVTGDKDSIKSSKGNIPTGLGFYCWLINHDYPAVVQVLCYNCRTSLKLYGCCPHPENQVQ